MNVTLREVKRVAIGESFEGDGNTNRDIIIELNDGREVTIELWTSNAQLKVEID